DLAREGKLITLASLIIISSVAYFFFFDSTAKTDLIEVETPNKQATIRVRAVPLPPEITRFLEDQENKKTLRKILFGSATGSDTSEASGSSSAATTSEAKQPASTSTNGTKEGSKTNESKKKKGKTKQDAEAVDGEGEEEGAAPVSLKSEQ